MKKVNKLEQKIVVVIACILTFLSFSYLTAIHIAVLFEIPFAKYQKEVAIISSIVIWCTAIYHSITKTDFNKWPDLLAMIIVDVLALCSLLGIFIIHFKNFALWINALMFYISFVTLCVLFPVHNFSDHKVFTIES